MASAFVFPPRLAFVPGVFFVVLLMIHDPQDEHATFVEHHASDQAIAVVPDVEDDTVADSIRSPERLGESAPVFPNDLLNKPLPIEQDAFHLGRILFARLPKLPKSRPRDHPHA